jgi:hypothetical protein
VRHSHDTAVAERAIPSEDYPGSPR